LRDGADGFPKGYARMQVEGHGTMCNLKDRRRYHQDDIGRR
jgi:hypothetical protein